MSDFLLDENVELLFQTQLEARASGLRVYYIGDGIAPPKRTPDPDILIWIEEHDCILLTYNRSSMPGHVRDHLTAGRHIPGIMQLNPRMGIGAMVETLLLIWGAGLPGEFADQITYLSH